MKRVKNLASIGALSLLMLLAAGCNNNNDKNTQSDSLEDDSGVSMTYHNNDITFDFSSAGQFSGGQYTIIDFYITSGQDPDHHITNGELISFGSTSGDSANLSFVVGREGSTDTVNWWKERVNTYTAFTASSPSKMNFAFIGDLTIELYGKYFIFWDFAIGQSFGYTNKDWPDNYWLYGGNNCQSNLAPSHGIVCNAEDEDGNIVQFVFTPSDNSIVDISRWISSN